MMLEGLNKMLLVEKEWKLYNYNGGYLVETTILHLEVL